jgi:myo-inositol-1(or 4)-monophosphatase
VTTPRELLDLAVATAIEAGALVVERRRGEVAVAQTKSSPTDVVTAVDIASEQLIRDRILAARPDDGFLGEEGDDIDGTSGVTWIADPIDGTVNFLYGIPQFAISIAAAIDDEVVAGVVLDATSGELFAASHGGGATLDDAPIHVGGCEEIAKTLVGVGYHYRADVRRLQAAEIAALLPVVRDVRRMGSAALDLCYVASGRYDAYVERGLKPWDLAAARLIVIEAGGKVEGLFGEPAGELIVTAASSALYDDFHAALEAAGFGDWRLADWPA